MFIPFTSFDANLPAQVLLKGIIEKVYLGGFLFPKIPTANQKRIGVKESNGDFKSGVARP
jgi:hypothetical protein